MMWENIFKEDNVEKDDPVWQEYVDKAAVFDVRIMDEWNKTIDVLLVFVGLFIGILTSFIGSTFPKFHRDPADITNDLLVATYNQLVAQSKNVSIPAVDPTSFFDLSEADYDAAATQNALLFLSLSLSIIVSVISLLAKLWLVSYSHQASSVGSPYDRAMKRQEAYNGLLIWNVEGVINMLPIILLIALYLFGFFIYVSVFAVQINLGAAIGSLLCVGVMFIGCTSLAAAFVPGCPYRSAFSAVIKCIFKILLMWIPLKYLPSSKSSIWVRRMWIGSLTILWLASNAAVAYATLITSTWFSLFFFSTTIPISYSARQEATHKPQKYKIPLLVACVFVFVILIMFLAVWFKSYSTFIPLFVVGVLVLAFGCWIFSNMSKSMADTGKTDAIAWLLETTPPPNPATFFKKVGQMTVDNFDDESAGCHYRSRLLGSLMPLLTPLITSYHAPEPPSSPKSDDRRPLTKPGDDMVVVNNTVPIININAVPINNTVLNNTAPIEEDLHLKNLEIYIACLGQLSKFDNSEGSYWCLKEDARQHPDLDKLLFDKLKELASKCHSGVVKSAAIDVLINFGKLDKEGNLRHPTPVLGSVIVGSKNALADNGLNSQERGHPNRATLVEESEDVKSLSLSEE